ncbi:gamma-aminobutyric acid type B receptor subunit 2-like [Penaeus vannamei]|uniref:gamma-aminobutyric acid type B receptor subunit 2-like n=1 Tax=Penaeus vannamei TaxID=6689 RepID=UPI00387F6A2B
MVACAKKCINCKSYTIVLILQKQGPISFDCPDRVGVTAFYQIQGGAPVKVALYHPEGESLDLSCPGCHALVWPGGEVPASRVFKLRVETVDPAAFILMSSLATLGILMALAFLAFNLTHRRLKYIKLSSPRLNNTTVVGTVLVYTAVILLGLDHATLPSPHYFPVVCTARAYLLSAGFSLAFGSMFTKTYRVHQIFTRSNSAGVVKNKLLKDKQLIGVIMVLLVVDIIIVSAWMGVDPMTRHLHNLTLEEHREVVFQPQVEVCRSEHTSEWLGALYVYKGLLVSVGVYMAWETRHVKIPALNDSQYIGMSVYNVVITSIIVIVAANVLGERTTLAYVIITTLVFVSTTTTLCLLFIPKILTILRKVEEDPIVESMGLKIQSNTRRLLTEDKRERFYRVEIQNKVYRRELLKLEQELQKLVLRRMEEDGEDCGGGGEGGGGGRGGGGGGGGSVRSHSASLSSSSSSSSSNSSSSSSDSSSFATPSFIEHKKCWSCGGACGCGWRADGQGDYRRRLPHPFPLLPGGKLLVGVLGGREYSTSSLPPPPHTQFLRVLHEADLPFSMSSRGDLPLCVNSRDLPFSISTHIQHGPRVSFQEDLKSGKKSKKKKSKTSSRSAGNSRSSKDIRLKMEWSACLSDEKLSPPMVEYKVSDLGLLCPLRRMKMAKGEDEKLISEGSAAGEGMGNSYCSAAAASALNHRWRAQVNQPEASKIKKANTTSSTFSSMTTEPATVASGVARSNAHVFSTVIVHRVGGNVHM